MRTKRESLMHLTSRHLEKVDRIAKRANYDRADYQSFLTERYDSLFGALRIKSKQVPSDELRKSLVVHRLLDLVDERRDEMLEDAARASCST